MLKASAVHRLFLGSLALKGFNAMIEAVGGVALLFVKTADIVRFVEYLTQAELHRDPHDRISTTLLHFAHDLSVSSKEFFAFYLAAHGIIKLIIVIGLLREKMWMFPVGLSALGCFVTYQLYRFAIGQSIGLLFLTILDMLIMWFIWREWQVKRGEALA